jgi:hypothetical protein
MGKNDFFHDLVFLSYWRADPNLRVNPVRFSKTPDWVQFKIVGYLAQALQLSGVLPADSALPLD